jgi:RNA polymerase sigma factor (sigma-70 family)
VDSRRSLQRSQSREKSWLSEQDETTNTEASAVSRLDLSKVLACLSPDQAIVVSLCYGAGLSHGEAAQALKMPLGTVKSHAARGRDRMLEMLQAKDPFGASQPPSVQDGN